MFRCLTCIVLLATADSNSSGTLIQQLPEDGSWESFHWVEEWNDGTNRTMKVILKSVGKSTVDGQPCRWIEFEFLPEMPAGKSYTQKLLIPEAQFASGGDPLSHVKEAWGASEDEAPKKLSFEYIQQVRPRLDIWLPPVVEKLERTKERRAVDWQQGRLQCHVFAGTQQFKYGYGNVDVAYRLSISEQAPFGIAAASLKTHEHAGDFEDAGTIEITMTDMGKGAVSKLKNVP